MPYPLIYHRPDTLQDALQLLARKGVSAAVLAGGTRLNPDLADIEELVDLQAVGLDEVSHGENRLSLGAMVRLQRIVDDEQAPPLLREMARREGPNTLRHAATIGGTIVAGDPESELVAALLVFNADVTIRNANGGHTMPLADFYEDVAGHLRGAILTGVALETDGATAHERVARTPQDKPIVAAVARYRPSGAQDGATALLALCGVASRPILVGPEDIAALQPPADFRGSSEYRQEMARILAKRVLNELQDN